MGFFAGTTRLEVTPGTDQSVMSASWIVHTVFKTLASSREDWQAKSGIVFVVAIGGPNNTRGVVFVGALRRRLCSHTAEKHDQFEESRELHFSVRPVIQFYK